MDHSAGDGDVLAGDLRDVADGLRRLSAGRWRERREAVREVVQRWADLDADLEGEPRRDVPWLEGDPALADQLAVVGDDLLQASAAAPEGPAVVRAVRNDLDRLRRL